MTRCLKRIHAGRYEGDGIILQKRNLYGQPWQAYRAEAPRAGATVVVRARKCTVHEHAGSYGSLEEALFHLNAAVSK